MRPAPPPLPVSRSGEWMRRTAPAPEPSGLLGNPYTKYATPLSKTGMKVSPGTLA